MKQGSGNRPGAQDNEAMRVVEAYRAKGRELPAIIPAGIGRAIPNMYTELEGRLLGYTSTK